jgi:hypothetical protein
MLLETAVTLVYNQIVSLERNIEMLEVITAKAKSKLKMSNHVQLNEVFS